MTDEEHGKATEILRQLANIYELAGRAADIVIDAGLANVSDDVDTIVARCFHLALKLRQDEIADAAATAAETDRRRKVLAGESCA